jgi:folate-binding Fe-S cluster repair protein YgfZ
VIDLSFRSRICLTGADRARFLHGQVTNDVKKLRAGEGCYAAITTAKGKMESDLNIFALADELLLDFEPGLTEKFRNGWKNSSSPTTCKSWTPRRITVC